MFHRNVTATLVRTLGTLMLLALGGATGARADGGRTEDRGSLRVGEVAIALDADVLRELREAAAIVDRDPTNRGRERAAGRLSRGALDALDEINMVLQRTGIAPPGPPRVRECLGLSIDLTAAIGRYPEVCRLLSIGPSGPRCAVELAILTRDIAELEGCEEWRGPSTGHASDSDGDGVVDALDACPYDPEKTWEGWCGCGVADRDDDGNGVVDCLEGCIGDHGACVDDPDEGDCSPIGMLTGACGTGVP